MTERSVRVTAAKIFGTFFPLLSICAVVFGFTHYREPLGIPEESWYKYVLSLFAAIELFLLYVVFFESNMMLPAGIMVSNFMIPLHIFAFLGVAGLAVYRFFFAEPKTNHDKKPEKEPFLIVGGILLLLIILQIKRSYCVWIMYKWSRDPNNPKSSQE